MIQKLIMNKNTYMYYIPLWQIVINMKTQLKKGEILTWVLQRVKTTIPGELYISLSQCM